MTDWLEVALAIVAVPVIAAFYPFLGWLQLRRSSKAADSREAEWDRVAAEMQGVHIRLDSDGYRAIRCESSGRPVEVAVRNQAVSLVTGTTIPFLRIRLPVRLTHDAAPQKAGRLCVTGEPIPSALLAALEKDLLAHHRHEDVTLEASEGRLTIRVRYESLGPNQVRAWVERASRWASAHELTR